MTITISPDYDLFVQIFFVLWVLKGIITLSCGLTQAEKPHYEKYGGFEIICGILILLLATWVLF